MDAAVRDREVRDSLRGVTNSPYQSGDPRFGPQPPPGQYPSHPGFQPPTQPYGAPPPYGVPIPRGMYPPGPPFPPPRKKKRTGLWLLLGAVVGLVVFAVGGLGLHRLGDSIPPSTVVVSSDDVSVGECVQVEARQASLVVKRASCSGSGFRYVVASVSVGKDICGPEYAKFWFSSKYPSANGALCLAEVLHPGSCYYISAATEGLAIAETREIDCAKPVVIPGATNIRVNSKTAGKPTCPESQSEYFIPRPTPTGYCLTFLE